MWRCAGYLALLLVPTALLCVGLHAAALSAILHAAHAAHAPPQHTGPGPEGPQWDRPPPPGGSGLAELVDLLADQEDPARRARLDWATFQAQQVRESE